MTTSPSTGSEPPPSTCSSSSAAPSPLCQVCTVTGSRYKCPGCGIRFCSVPCSREHKQQSKCSGKRDKTRFVAMNEYHEGHFMSDYCLLEEIDRHLDRVERSAGTASIGSCSTSSNPSGKQHQLPYRKKQLMAECRQPERQVSLQWMHGLQRHSNNTSYFHAKKRLVFWRVEFRFPHLIGNDKPGVGGPGLVFVDKGTSELEPITAVLAKLFAKHQEGTALNRHAILPYLPSMDALIQSQAASSSDISDMHLKIVMEKVGSPANRRQYFRVDPKKTIQQTLRGNTVLEFPTFVVYPAEYTFPENVMLMEDDLPEQTTFAPVVEEVVTVEEGRIWEGEKGDLGSTKRTRTNSQQGSINSS